MILSITIAIIILASVYFAGVLGFTLMMVRVIFSSSEPSNAPYYPFKGYYPFIWPKFSYLGWKDILRKWGKN